MTAITNADLTTTLLDGTGVFDVLMQANKAHLEAEFQKGRIKGPEYATVYLGALNQVLQTATAFLLARDKASLEANLIQKQIDLAQIQIEKTQSEKAQVEAQTLLITQQRANLVAEAANLPKQGALIDAQKDAQLATKAHTEAQSLLVAQQRTNLIAEAENLPKQGALIDAQTAAQTATKLHTEAETLIVPKQGQLIDAQKDSQVATKLHTEAQTLLVTQQKENAIIEGTVLVAQECKLRAEYDLTLAATQKSTEETALLAQKVATERAQITSMGVDADSVVGRQKSLYLAQADGFKRDAEQKAAKLMVDTWNVRRTTDEATAADGTNLLNDASVGRAVSKLLSGVGA